MLYTEKIAKDLVKAISDINIKAEGDEYEMIISKEVSDRSGEIVVLDGMDAKSYKKNPVVLIDHSYRVEDIVGKTIKLTRDGDFLKAKFVFAETENGQLAEKLYNQGLLKTSSIGFLVKERDSNDYSRITKWELLEWSLVAVPCNPEALSADGKQLYKKGLEAGIIKDVSEEEEQNGGEIYAEDIKEIKAELSEIKEMMKKFADDKADEKKVEEEKQKALEQKELLQAINRGTATALENIKKLEK